MVTGHHKGRIQLIIRAPTQRPAYAPVISRVAILAAIGSGIVYPTIFVALIANEANRQFILNYRHIDHAADTQAIGIALGFASFDIDGGVIARWIGLVGHITDRPSQ